MNVSMTLSAALVLGGLAAAPQESERGASGLRLTLLFDTSASAEGLDEALHAVGLSLVEGLGRDDLAQVLTTGDRPDVVVPFTSDTRTLTEAILGVRVKRSATILYNALYIAFKRAQADAGDGRRSAVVVVTDGHDTNSMVTRDQLAALSRATEARLYAVLVGKDVGRDRFAERFLTSLAEDSGGMAFTPTSVDDLKRACETLVGELAAYRAAESAP